MSLRREAAGLALLAALVLLPFVVADEPKKPAAEDKEAVTSKAVKRTSAASVNFRKQLGLPFHSLGTLGQRIDAARKAHDPVSLAHTANELSVAESVSGKTADVTSKALLKESAELAAMRRQEKELNALLKIQQQMQDTADNLALTQSSLDLAKESVNEDTRWIRANEEPTWKPRQVVVNNYTTQYLDIWVNGNYKAQVSPGGAKVIVIEHRWNPTVLTADGDEDSVTYGPRYVWGRFTKYTWNIE